jgi:CubicO group peptidase (beta-lactamase class C family)
MRAVYESFVPRVGLIAALSVVSACASDDEPDTELWPTKGWQVRTPEQEGMSSSVLEGTRAYAFAEGKNTQGVVVVRHGVIVAEWYAEGANERSWGASWSMAKSFTSALVGIAIDEGLIPGVDVSMAEYFSSWKGTEKENIKLENVLQMASGLRWQESYDPADLSTSDIITMVLAQSDELAYAESREVDVPPGTRFNYSSGDTMLLSGMLEMATGRSAGDYAAEKIFGPLGMTQVEWWRDAPGHTLTYCCLDTPTRDFARFGLLYEREGKWEDGPVVPSSWVRASVEPSATDEGYGYKWWLTGRTKPGIPADTFSARGHDGQFIYVIPSLDIVAVRNGLYVKYEGEPVADPNLFGFYPSDGLVQGQGTIGPADWDDVAFLKPIIDSITE